MKAALVGWPAVSLACGVLTCGYVGLQAVQEDNRMRPWSPLAWLLVDGRLWHLEPAEVCSVAGYYSTVGDGPKLPGSDVTLHCAMTRADIEAWARQWLTRHGFRAKAKPSWWPPESEAPTSMETDTALADYELAELPDGRVALRIAIRDLPR
jgi:hypothetical protein